MTADDDCFHVLGAKSFWERSFADTRGRMGAGRRLRLGMLLPGVRGTTSISRRSLVWLWWRWRSRWATFISDTTREAHRLTCLLGERLLIQLIVRIRSRVFVWLVQSVRCRKESKSLAWMLDSVQDITYLACIERQPQYIIISPSLVNILRVYGPPISPA